jgi:sulfur-oxidizing protein SoxX
MPRALRHLAALGPALAAAFAPAGDPARGEEAAGGPPPESIVAYTIADGRAIPRSLTGAPGDPARGAQLFGPEAEGGAGCADCHRAARIRAGGTAPGALRLWIVAPAAIDPETEMPAYYAAGQRDGAADPLYNGPRLTARDVEDLVAYLAGGAP